MCAPYNSQRSLMSPACLLKPFLLCSHRLGYNNVFQAVSLLHHQQGQDKVYGPQLQAWSSDRKGKGVQEMGLLVCDPRRQDRKVWGCEESQLAVHPFQPLGGPRQATQPLPTWVIHL